MSEQALGSHAGSIPADSPVHCMTNSWFASFPACAGCRRSCPWDEQRTPACDEGVSHPVEGEKVPAPIS